MFDYCQEAKKAVEELDKYDLSDILKQCYEIGWRDPWDIGERGIIGKYPELEGSVHALDLDELMEYLMKKISGKVQRTHFLRYVPSVKKQQRIETYGCVAEWKRQQGYAVQESAAHSNLLGLK